MTRRSSLEATALTGSEPTIRVYRDPDEDQVVALWHACGLTKDYNPPAGDIAFCRATPTAELFVAEDDGRVVATATEAGYTTSRSNRHCAARVSAAAWSRGPRRGSQRSVCARST